MMEQKIIKIKKIAGIIFWVYAAALLAAMVINGWLHDLSSDSTVTIKYSRQSFSAMMDWIMHVDVHPPFYYMMLWAISRVVPAVSQFYTLFSVIPFLLIIIMAGTSIRREFGEFASFLLVTFWGMMTQSMVQLVEARMYAWGAFFVFASLYSLYFVLKENTVKRWILFVAVSLMGMYTHYYVLFQIFFIVAYLILHTIIFRRDLWKRTLGGALVLLLGYLPWLFVLLKQSSAVQTGEFWITEEISLRTCIWYLFSFADGYELLLVFFVHLFISLLLIKKVFYLESTEGKKKIRFAPRNIMKRASKPEYYMIQIGVLSGFATIATGFILSRLLHPMIYDRYIYFAATGLWFVISASVSLSKSKWLAGVLTVYIMATILIHNVPVMADHIQEGKESYDFKNRIYAELKPEENPETVLITDEKMQYYPLSSFFFSSWEVVYVDGEELTFAEALAANDEAPQIYYFVSEDGKLKEDVSSFSYVDEGTMGESYMTVYKVR